MIEENPFRDLKEKHGNVITVSNVLESALYNKFKECFTLIMSWYKKDSPEERSARLLTVDGYKAFKNGVVVMVYSDRDSDIDFCEADSLDNYKAIRIRVPQMNEYFESTGELGYEGLALIAHEVAHALGAPHLADQALSKKYLEKESNAFAIQAVLQDKYNLGYTDCSFVDQMYKDYGADDDFEVWKKAVKEKASSEDDED